MIIAAERIENEDEGEEGEERDALIRKPAVRRLWPAGRRQAPGPGQKAVCCSKLPPLNPLNRDTQRYTHDAHARARARADARAASHSDFDTK